MIPAIAFAMLSSHRNQIAPTPSLLNISTVAVSLTPNMPMIETAATRTVEIQKVIFIFFETVIRKIKK